MADLFKTDRTSIVRHINNIYKSDELEREAICAKIAQVQIEGKRKVTRNIPYFNRKFSVENRISECRVSFKKCHLCASDAETDHPAGITDSEPV